MASMVCIIITTVSLISATIIAITHSWSYYNMGGGGGGIIKHFSGFPNILKCHGCYATDRKHSTMC